jgi:hypothetical protein
VLGTLIAVPSGSRENGGVVPTGRQVDTYRSYRHKVFATAGHHLPFARSFRRVIAVMDSCSNTDQPFGAIGGPLPCYGAGKCIKVPGQMMGLFSSAGSNTKQ